MATRGKFDYEFSAVTGSRYELLVEMLARNRMIELVFERSKSKLAKKGVSVAGDLRKVDRFSVDSHYLKLIGTVLQKKVRKMEEEVFKDGIQVLSSSVDRAEFVRRGADWVIRVWFAGNYADRRER